MNINTILVVAGFVLTIGLYLLQTGALVARLEAADAAAMQRIMAIEQDRTRRMDESGDWRRATDERLRALEVNSATVITRLVSIEGGVKRIEDKLTEDGR